MKSRMAGVALAAVVGVCALAGGVGRAEAALVRADYTVGGMTSFFQGDFNNPVDEIGFIYSGKSFFRSSSSSDLSEGFFSEFSGDNFFGSISSSYASASYNDEEYSAAGSADLFRELFNTNMFSGSTENPGFFEDENGNPVFYSQSFSATVSFTEVSSVPLPASAPMFAAALLALGGLSYARRRGAVSVEARSVMPA